MSQTNARFPVFISTAHERFPRDGRRGSQKHALWLGLGRGCIRNSPATQSENNPESTCQPKWQLAVGGSKREILSLHAIPLSEIIALMQHAQPGMSTEMVAST